ncbi:HEPN domain-containing protein [Methanosarcina sp.]|uniref:HEPN domain-containing protein n=1 Tax=Methanosarcina sp. TaxID=2213 RepID=UPI003C782331
MNWRECEAEKLIKHDSRAWERIPVSLSTAERFLRSAQKNLEIEEYEMVQLAAYNSAFHSARALLFSRGYTERSYSSLGIALKHLYKEDYRVLKLANIFDKMRVSRHNVQYGGIFVTFEEASFSISFAEEMYHAVSESLQSY